MLEPHADFKVARRKNEEDPAPSMSWRIRLRRTLGLGWPIWGGGDRSCMGHRMRPVWPFDAFVGKTSLSVVPTQPRDVAFFYRRHPRSLLLFLLGVALQMSNRFGLLHIDFFVDGRENSHLIFTTILEIDLQQKFPQFPTKNSNKDNINHLWEISLQQY
jgi:hypothetical protein